MLKFLVLLCLCLSTLISVRNTAAAEMCSPQSQRSFSATATTTTTSFPNPVNVKQYCKERSVYLSGAEPNLSNIRFVGDGPILFKDFTCECGTIVYFQRAKMRKRTFQDGRVYWEVSCRTVPHECTEKPVRVKTPGR